MRMHWIRLGILLLLAASACTQQKDRPPVVIDDCESLEVSRKTWQMTGVTAELSDEHVTGGKHSLKLTFSRDRGLLQLKLPRRRTDWSSHKALHFDVYNPQDHVIELLVRIDDAWARGFKDRFEPCGQVWLAPRRSTHMEITLDDLQANNFRLLDTSRITHLNLHLGKASEERVLYVDSFQLTPLPEEELARRVPEATEPLVIDGAESPEKSKLLWKASEAGAEISEEHATEGKHALKVTYPPSEGWPGLRLVAKEKPMDWRPYKTLLFDAYNPADKPLEISVRIDDPNTLDKSGRFVVNDVPLPPRKTTTVKIDIWRMASLCGLKMDKSRITLLVIYVNPSRSEQVAYIDNIRLGITPGGLRNELRPGPIPGEDPVSLGKKLLEDPEIKPLIPIFKAIPPKRMAICSHSASITAHWSTSGAFFDIAAEAVRSVNPNLEYKGFHRGGMGAGTAVQQFLEPMKEYKPTDTYLLVVPRPMEAEQKLIDEMKAVGSRVFVFDAIKSWSAHSPQLQEDLRRLCEDRGATFLPLMARGWGAPGAYKWTTTDTIHMTTAGHIFYARELLKEWARIYGAETPGHTNTGATPGE